MEALRIMKACSSSGQDRMGHRRRLGLISAAGAVCGAAGLVMDRSRRLRGFFVGAVTGASFAGMILAKLHREGEAFGYYSEGRRLYEPDDNEAGI